MQLALFIIGLALFIGLVLVHEWGHYIVARRNGVKVDEFGLGFPPRAWGKKLKSGMVLSLNWLPLGGFVKLQGEHDADNKPGSFGAASLWVKTKILLAGVGMNFLTGLVLLVILALIGMPKLITPDTVGQEQFTVASDTKITSQQVQAGYIQPGSPAERAGLNGRDIIVRLARGNDVRNIQTTQQLHDATQAFGGQQITLTYKHSGQELTKVVQLRDKASVAASLKTSDPKGFLGVSPNNLQLRRSTWSAPIVAVGFTKQLVFLTFQGIGKALAGLGSTIAGGITGNHTAREKGQDQASSQVGGPVSIVEFLWGGGDLGLRFMLMIIAIISLTLALMNVLPIPALDGGRLFVILVTRLFRRRPLSQLVEERVHATGMAVLLGLIVLITVVDIKRFF